MSRSVRLGMHFVVAVPIPNIAMYYTWQSSILKYLHINITSICQYNAVLIFTGSSGLRIVSSRREERCVGLEICM